MTEHVIEICAMRESEWRRSNRLHDKREQRDMEVEEMAQVDKRDIPPNHVGHNSTNAPINAPEKLGESDMTLADMLYDNPNNAKPDRFIEDAFKKRVRLGYEDDKLLSLVVAKPMDYPTFTVRDDLIWKRNLRGDEVLCVPRDRELLLEILTQAHESVGHFGGQRTDEYIRRWYWWPFQAKETREFCATCEACQRSKPSTKLPVGKHHPLPIPTKPWDSIGMDFVGPFPESKGFNYLWVIICRMTSMVHLIPVHTTMTAMQLSWVYRREIVRLHGLPNTIVSDRNSKFTSKWWRELHRILGAKLLMSTSFHPQTDGQTERANRNVGQIFRSVVRHDQKDWVDRVDLTEFAINASVAETTKFAPFELNGGYMPSMIKEIRSDETIPKGIRQFAETALQNLADAHDAIIEAHVFQTNRMNARRQREPEIMEGSLVYLSTKNLNLPKGRARKLCPKFVGPWKVVKA